MKKEIIIDATDKKLGRLASEVASSLRGKTDPDFLPNRTTFSRVIVKNVDAMSLSEKKLKETFFGSYSGYPGGLRQRSASSVAAKDKRELLKRAVSGMLKNNRIKTPILKGLILYHGDKE